MKHTVNKFETCLENEPPFCTVDCPFHLDVRDFIAKMQRGGFNVAYRAFLNAVGFPGIVTALCPQPCQAVCPREDRGGAIAMGQLEKAAMAYARNLEPNRYNVPAKHKRVGIIGGGISGLACALRMAERGYDVTVFERSARIGGHLHEVLSPDIFLADIERQGQYVSYDLRLNTEIRDLKDLDFDALYVATGAGGHDFGLEMEPNGAFATTTPGVFCGGSFMGADTMHALADGLRVSHAMERYIKAAGMNQPEEVNTTRLQLDVTRFPFLKRVEPHSGESYSKDEAIEEAKRCLSCACDACIRACDLMRYFKKFPKRIAEEVHLTVYPGTLDGNGTLATRLISTCNHCGLCREVCPQKIDVGELFLTSHQAMREKGAMPWAFHEFFLRDMAFTNGEASLFRSPQGVERCRYLFFPGCQLGASDPAYVTETYRLLLQYRPDTALGLGCCGAPAEWAGDEPLRDAAFVRLKQEWENLGKPTMILACPTCQHIFKRHLPEMKCVSLMEWLQQAGIAPQRDGNGTVAAVFDPCSSREMPALQDTVRALAIQAGFTLVPLPMEGAVPGPAPDTARGLEGGRSEHSEQEETHAFPPPARKGHLSQCCSWGGQVSVAHPPYARYVAQNRITQSDDPLITYCINCRDIFSAAGKLTWHILDILLNINGPDRVPPTLSGRRRNRLQLKQQVMAAFWAQSNEVEEAPMALVIAPELQKKLSDGMILESDIAAVIDHCEATGKKVLNPATGSFSGHLQIGCMTFWAEYRVLTEGGFELVNAYGHRMNIEEA